jgi:hypothetical protein
MHFEIITMDDLFDVCRDFVVKGYNTICPTEKIINKLRQSLDDLKSKRLQANSLKEKSIDK